MKADVWSALVCTALLQLERQCSMSTRVVLRIDLHPSSSEKADALAEGLARFVEEKLGPRDAFTFRRLTRHDRPVVRAVSSVPIEGRVTSREVLEAGLRDAFSRIDRGCIVQAQVHFPDEVVDVLAPLVAREEPLALGPHRQLFYRFSRDVSCDDVKLEGIRTFDSATLFTLAKQLCMPKDYVGVVDAQGGILLCMVEEVDRIWAAVQDEEKRGSHGACLTGATLAAFLYSLPATFDEHTVPNARFRRHERPRASAQSAMPSSRSFVFSARRSRPAFTR